MAITDHRSKNGAAELAADLLERDRGPTYLVGRQHDCARSRYYCRAIEDRPGRRSRGGRPSA